jgi:hypothetical protein
MPTRSTPSSRAPSSRAPSPPDDDPYAGFPRPIDAMTGQEIEDFGRNRKIWTRQKMRRFLRALMETASVKHAAESVGMSRQAAYRLRSRLVGDPFDLAWECALEFGLRQLGHAALDRALNGVEEPVFHDGEQVGTRTRFDTRLTLYLLANPIRTGRKALLREYHLHSWDTLLDEVTHGPLHTPSVQEEMAANADPGANDTDIETDTDEQWAEKVAARHRAQAQREAEDAQIAAFAQSRSDYMMDTSARWMFDRPPPRDPPPPRPNPHVVPPY